MLIICPEPLLCVCVVTVTSDYHSICSYQVQHKLIANQEASDMAGRGFRPFSLEVFFVVDFFLFSVKKLLIPNVANTDNFCENLEMDQR